jgi:copper chaperone
METYTFQVDNLKCSGCANTISKQIGQLTSVSKVVVDKDAALVEVSAKSGMREQIKSRLADLGYPEVGSGNVLHAGISYVSCAIGKFSSSNPK